MDYKERYNLWKNANLEEHLRKQLDSYSDNDIKESFINDIEFGTGGLRGIRGPGSAKMNIYNVKKVTLGYANYLQKNFSNIKQISVVASYDNRHFSYEFALRACKVLEAKGIKTYIFSTLTPTPILSYAVSHLKCQGGIMLTASHNPKEYNGYKVYNEDGAQLNLTQSNSCIEEIEKITDIFNIEESSVKIEEVKPSLIEDYLKQVRKNKINNPTKKLKIVYSPLHGTGSTVIPQFLKSEGYNVFPLESQMTVDPDFSNTLSSNPEDPKSFIEAIKYAKTIDASLILLSDPDADRLGFAYKNKEGEYVLVTGNQTASIMVYYKLSELAKKNKKIRNGVVFTTNVTSDLVKVIAQSFDCKVVTTLTGFKNIADGIAKMKKNEKFVFGCEESYGSILNDFVRDKDSVQACYNLSEIACYLEDSNLDFESYLDQIYSVYGYYYEYTHNYVKPGLDGKEKIAAIMSYVRKNGISLENTKIIGFDDCTLDLHIDYVNNKESKLGLEWSNVLKYYFDNGLFVVLRPSGTEPKLKVYFSFPGKTLNQASDYVNECFKSINKIVERF
ncbi:MAG: phospho-sugar mutase [Acholeplasmatales bacterium]|nr:phospho-sugar mutase [Acholeplasmatales bacterium]